VWLEAIYLTLMSSKGVSSNVLARQLGIDQSSAWKMAHAIRLLSRPPEEERLSGTVEIDMIVIAGDPKKRNICRYGPSIGKLIHNPRGRGSDAPTILVAIEKPPKDLGEPIRAGRARAAPVEGVSVDAVGPPLSGMVDVGAVLDSDADKTFKKVGSAFAEHQTIVHSDKEYTRNVCCAAVPLFGRQADHIIV
jgi:hypothetical protein